jgi:hypothetical protein
MEFKVSMLVIAKPNAIESLSSLESVLPINEEPINFNYSWVQTLINILARFTLWIWRYLKKNISRKWKCNLMKIRNNRMIMSSTKVLSLH